MMEKHIFSNLTVLSTLSFGELLLYVQLLFGSFFFEVYVFILELKCINVEKYNILLLFIVL